MQSNMRIAFVLTSYAMGGMEMRSARIAKDFARLGHSMHYGCPHGSKLEASLRASGVTIFDIHIHGALDLLSAIKLASYLKRHKIQLLMALSGADYWATIIAAKLVNIPVILSRSTATPLNFMTAWFSRNADCVLAVSHGIKTLLQDQRIPEDKIEVIYNGIDTHLFSPNNLPDRHLVRQKLNIPTKKFVIGCLARAEKGQALLLSLDESLQKGCHHIHYYFAGQNIPQRLGPILKDCLQLERRVTLRDMIAYEDIPAILHAMDVVVMLPETEPFSNAVIEAMAMSKPTVLSKTTGNIEAVEDGVSGYLVDIHDSGQIIKALSALHEDPLLAHQMGKAARNRAVQLFSQQTMLEKYASLYRKLINYSE